MAGDPHGFGAVVDYCRNAAIGQTASRIKKFSKNKCRRAILKLQQQSTVMGAGATRNLGFVPASVIRSLLPPSSGVLTHDHAPAFLPRLMVDSVVNHIVERTEKPVVRRDRKRRRGMASQLRRRRRRAAVRAFARETKKAEVERPIPVRGSIEGPWPFDIGQVITNEPEVVDLDYRIDSAEADRRRPFKAPMRLTRRSWKTCYQYWRDRYLRGGYVSPHVVGKLFYQQGGPSVPAFRMKVIPPPQLELNMTEVSYRHVPLQGEELRVVRRRNKAKFLAREACVHGKRGNCFACDLIAETLASGGWTASRVATASGVLGPKSSRRTGHGGGSQAGAHEHRMKMDELQEEGYRRRDWKPRHAKKY